MSNILNPIESLPEINFINNITLEELLTEMVNNYQDKYEEITGNKITLAKSDPSRLILYACAVSIYQGYQYIDRAGKQDLLKYSYGEFLENIAAMKGVTRNQAKPATVFMRFTLSEQRNSAIPIPIGTRVSAGEIYFESTEYSEIPVGETSVDIEMVCSQAGVIGNGFLVGELTILVNPLPYISSVVNITQSSGGTEIESDESLAERTFIAPSSYSTAGPDDAYIYWAKTYSQDIADVSVYSPSPCVVDLRFILRSGVIPDDTMIQGLYDFLNDKKIKPLTDQVIVNAPNIVEYNISLTYWINKSDSIKAIAIQNEVNTAVSNYIEWQNTKIGRDINPSELIKHVMAAGVKRVLINSPTHTEVPADSIAKLISSEVIYGGIEND